MPLDTSIPLQIAQAPQMQTINPMSIYTAMQERQVNALRAQALQQEMQRNALIMQNTMEDRAAARAQRAQEQALLARRREILGNFGVTDRAVGAGPGLKYSNNNLSSSPFDYTANKLIATGDIGTAEALRKAQNEALTGQKTATETAGLDLKNLNDEFNSTKTLIGSAGSPEAVLSIFDAKAPLITAIGGNPEKSKQDFTAMLSNPSYGATPQERFQNAVLHVSQGIAGMQKHVSDMLVAQKPELKNISGTGMVAINPYTGEGKRVTIDGAPLSTTASEVPELKKGERWNAEKQRVEATEGSDIYIAQSAKHGKDFNAVKTVQSATDAALANIDKILAPENEDAFNSNFGGSTYLGSRYQPGKTQAIGAAIDSLKSTMKATGAQLMRSQGGAVGSITEREWPILEGMVAALKPEMPEQDARDVIANVRQRLANLNDISKETYDTTWGNTQYYKPNAGGKKTSDTTDSKSVFDAADAILGGK